MPSKDEKPTEECTILDSSGQPVKSTAAKNLRRFDPWEFLVTGFEHFKSSEGYVKVFIVPLGTLYVVGLLVSSYHLARCGILYVNFARPLYIFTGIWALLPLFFILLIRLYFLWTRSTYGCLITHSTTLFVVGAIFWFLIPKVLIMIGDFLPPLLRFVPGFDILYATYSAFYLFILVLMPLMRGQNLLIGILWVGICLFLFTMVVYPLIPVQMGGGSPRLVVLKMEEGKDVGSTLAGLRVDYDNWPLVLIAETDEAYVVNAPRQSERDRSLRDLVRETDFYKYDHVVIPKRKIAYATFLVNEEIGSKSGSASELADRPTPAEQPSRGFLGSASPVTPSVTPSPTARH
jgi:hypothetical protein